MGEPLAWKVEDPDAYVNDGRAVVVFATSAKRAVVLGATALGEDTDPRGLEASRYPEADHLAPGPMKPADYLALDWWLTCGHCEEQVMGSSRDEEDPRARPVTTDTEAFCNQACHDAEVQRQREVAQRLAAIRLEVARRWPGAQILYALPGPGPRYSEGARFRFPGGRGDAWWDRTTGEVTVDLRDVVAWYDFDRHSAAGRPVLEVASG